MIIVLFPKGKYDTNGDTHVKDICEEIQTTMDTESGDFASAYETLQAAFPPFQDFPSLPEPVKTGNAGLNADDRVVEKFMKGPKLGEFLSKIIEMRHSQRPLVESQNGNIPGVVA